MVDEIVANVPNRLHAGGLWMPKLQISPGSGVLTTKPRNGVKRVPPRKRTRTPRDLVPLNNSGPGRFHSKTVRDIERDLGGRYELSRIEVELVQAFAAGAVALRYLNAQIVLGDTSALNLASFANLASTMLRIGSRLGFKRRAKEVTPDLYRDLLPSLTQQTAIEVSNDEV